MKTKRDRFKKILSLMLCVLLTAGTFCFFNPFTVPEADAATAGKYNWKVTLYVEDDYDWKHDAMNIFVDYYTNNGYGSNHQNDDTSYFHVWKNQYENDKANYSFEGWSNGFPTRVRLSTMKNKNKVWNANYRCILYVKQGNKWIELANSGKVTGIRRGQYLKNLDVRDCSPSNSNWPKVSSISISGGGSAEVPTSGDRKFNVSATVKDQYGVSWYQTPEKFFVTTGSTSVNAENIPGVTYSGNAADSTTISVSQKVNDWVSDNGTAYKRSFYVRAKKGGVYSGAATITLTNYKLSAKFYDYNESSKDWTSEIASSKPNPYYNYDNVISPAVSRTGWVFNGWTTDKNIPQGSQSINEKIKVNKTWYAQWEKELVARFNYFDSNGVLTKYGQPRTLKTNELSFNASAPQVPSTITYEDRTFRFLGWRANTAATQADTTVFTVTADNNPNTVKDFYAVYSGDITFRFDGNGGTVHGANKTQTQYLNASGNKTNHTFDLTGLTATRTNSDFAGWAETANAKDPVAANQTFTINSDKTVYAVYKCNVNFFDRGTLVSSQIITVGHMAADPYPLPETAPANRPRKAFDDDNEYYYDGWDKSLLINGHTDLNTVFLPVPHTYIRLDTPEYPDVKPTCTEDGRYTEECNHIMNDTGEMCHYLRTTIVPATGHDWETTKAAKAPTCTEKGWTAEITCKNGCGTIKQFSEDIPALGHDFVYDTTVPNTCVNEGYDLYVCRRDGCTATEKRNIVAPDSNKHNVIKVDEVPATCTSNGTTEYTICSICKAIIEPPKTITSEGHDWEIIKEAKDATCDEDGWTAQKRCKVCGVTVDSVTIPQTGHNYITYTAKDPTCTEGENTAGYRCTRCGKGNVTFTPALGHDWTEVTVIKEATCAEEGLKAGKCNRCGETQAEEIIPKTDHREEDIEYIEDIPATCTSVGYSWGEKCRLCGKWVTEPEKIKKLPHAWSVANDAVPPTCTESGKTIEYVCSMCHGKKGGNTVSALGHSYSAWVVTAPASCGVEGEKVRRCTNCNELETAVIPALTHNYVEVPEVPATCTENGRKAGKQCTICHAWETEPEIIPAKGHSYGEEMTVEATCTKEGKKYRVCAVCGEEEIIEIIEKAPHDEEIVPGTVPTCTRAGKTDGKRCKICGETTVPQTNIEPLEHTSVVDVAATAASCMQMGNTEGTKCAVCGKILVKARNIAADAHQLTAWTIVEKATCTSRGIKERHCTAEGCAYFEREYTPVLGHSYGEWLTVYEPTCEEEGMKRCICTRCGDVVDQPINAKGHSKVTVPAVPATCETDGVKTGVECSVCGVKFEGFEAIPATGHNYEMIHIDGDCENDSYYLYVCKNDPSHRYMDNIEVAPGHTGGTATCTQKAVCDVCGKEYGEYADHNYQGVVTAPTCTEAGYTTYTCTVCGDEYKADYTLSTGVHEYNDGIVLKAPSCTEAGLKEVACKHCGATEQVEIAAKGHNVAEWTIEGTTAKGTCTECGETITRPATQDEIKPCERCGYRHTRTTGLFKYKGVYCSIVYFFRQISKFFKGGR